MRKLWFFFLIASLFSTVSVALFSCKKRTYNMQKSLALEFDIEGLENICRVTLAKVFGVQKFEISPQDANLLKLIVSHKESFRKYLSTDLQNSDILPNGYLCASTLWLIRELESNSTAASLPAERELFMRFKGNISSETYSKDYFNSICAALKLFSLRKWSQDTQAYSSFLSDSTSYSKDYGHCGLQNFVPILLQEKGVLKHLPIIFTVDSFDLNDFKEAEMFDPIVLGLTSKTWGEDKDSSGKTLPKIDGEVMTPLRFFDHDGVHERHLIPAKMHKYFRYGWNTNENQVRQTELETRELEDATVSNVAPGKKDLARNVFFVLKHEINLEDIEDVSDEIFEKVKIFMSEARPTINKFDERRMFFLDRYMDLGMFGSPPGYLFPHPCIMKKIASYRKGRRDLFSRLSYYIREIDSEIQARPTDSDLNQILDLMFQNAELKCSNPGVLF